MGVSYNSVINRDGLVLHLVAGNSRSYPGTGTTWYDLSGNNNHGTMIGGPTYSSANGGVISFDGVNDYVQLPQSNLLKPARLTLCAYVYMNTTPGLDRIRFMAWDSGSQDAYGFRIKNAGFVPLQGFYFENSNNADSFFPTTIFNKWYHLTGTVGPEGTKFYVNGTLISTVALTTITYAGFGTQRFNIGFGGGAELFASFLTDDVRIYNRVILDTEIRQIFNSTRRRFGV